MTPESLPELAMHLKLAMAIPYVIEWLKKWPAFKWMTYDTKTVNRWVSAIAAAVATIGISLTYDPAVGGDVHIPALSVLLLNTVNWVGEWFGQFITQQVIYDGVVSKAADTKDTNP